jgi:hypothetical protein
MFFSGICGRYLPGICTIIALTVLIALIIMVQPVSVFCQAGGREDVSGYVNVSPSNEKSNLDKRSRMMASTADVAVTNTSYRTILPPCPCSHLTVP